MVVILGYKHLEKFNEGIKCFMFDGLDDNSKSLIESKNEKVKSISCNFYWFNFLHS